jgi:hypothetical protein
MATSPSPYHSGNERKVYILIHTSLTFAHFKLVKKQLWADAHKTRAFIVFCLN